MRMMCGASCTLTDDYMPEDTVCRHCGHTGLARSEHVDEDHWIIHQRNQKLVHYLKDLLNAVQHSVATFEKGWDETWNATGPTQLNYEPPEDYSGWLAHFEGD